MRRVAGQNVSWLEIRFFGDTNLSFGQILLIAYLWLVGLNWTSILQFTGHAKQTVTNFLENLRQLVEVCVEFSQANEENKIGGEGIIVAVDETKFGRRKYHKGHRVEGKS